MRKLTDSAYDRLIDEACAQMIDFSMSEEDALTEMRDLYDLTDDEYAELRRRFAEEMDYDFDDDYADEPADDDWDAYVLENAYGPDYEPDDLF